MTSIKFTIGDQTATGILFDNPTARDFASLLPITVDMYDLFGREKPGPLPRALDVGGDRVFSYEVGDLSYWSPNRDIAIFYAADRQAIPSPGLIRLGRVETGLDTIAQAGDRFQLRIEALD